MNRVPIPNFDDFSATCKHFRTSTWWTSPRSTFPWRTRGAVGGRRRHCVFVVSGRRSAVPSRTWNGAAGTEAAARRHGLNSFRFSDYILPVVTLHASPAFGTSRRRYHIIAEMKANIYLSDSNYLPRRALPRYSPALSHLAQAFLQRWIKGCHRYQNVYTLLLSKRFAVTIHYNLLYGFRTMRRRI
jgi:hypothetical protein